MSRFKTTRKRKGRRPKSSITLNKVFAFDWYRPEKWERLCEVAVDRDALEATHEEWKKNAESSLRELPGAGIVPRKVDVDIKELLSWCNSNKRDVDGNDRAAFVAEKLRRQNGC